MYLLDSSMLCNLQYVHWGVLVLDHNPGNEEDIYNAATQCKQCTETSSTVTEVFVKELLHETETLSNPFIGMDDHVHLFAH